MKYQYKKLMKTTSLRQFQETDSIRTYLEEE